MRPSASALYPLRSFAEIGTRAGRRRTLLRSCPPDLPFGQVLLLYFAPQSAPPACSAATGVFDDATPTPCPAKDVGWPTERSKGGGAGEARPGGHERSRPPDGLGCRAKRMTAPG